MVSKQTSIKLITSTFVDVLRRSKVTAFADLVGIDYNERNTWLGLVISLIGGGVGMGSFWCLVPKKMAHVQRVTLMLQVPTKMKKASAAYKRYRSEKKRKQRRRLRREKTKKIEKNIQTLRTILDGVSQGTTPASHEEPAMIANPTFKMSEETRQSPMTITRSGRIVKPPIRWEAPFPSKRPRQRRNVKRNVLCCCNHV